jgi:hypothetical protein
LGDDMLLFAIGAAGTRYMPAAAAYFNRFAAS